MSDYFNPYKHQIPLGDSSEVGSSLFEYDELDDKIDKKDDEDLYQEWQKEYSQDPERFFSEENLEKISDLPQDVRIDYFAHTSGRLMIKPELADAYFEKFPEDLDVLKARLLSQLDGPSSSQDLHLFSLAMPYLVEKYPELLDEDDYDNEGYHQDYLQLANNRTNTADRIIGDSDRTPELEDLKKFGQAASELVEILEDSIQSSLSIDAQITGPVYDVFTPEFDAMSPDEQAEFIQTAIVATHLRMLYDDTFNLWTFDCDEREDPDDPYRNQQYSMQQLSPHTGTYELVTNQKPDLYFGLQDTGRHGALRGILLQLLKCFKSIEAQSDENADLLVEFWQKNADPLLVNATADAMSAQNPNRSSGQLMERLQEEKGDKSALTAILYRLEFGRVGISEDGVRYLEKMYDLGAFNNPDYHVQRLTPRGEVGIFDEDLRLIKYFHLGDLSSPETKVRAQVLDFVYETLFTPRADESPQERADREQYLEEFKTHYYELAQSTLLKETSVDLNNLSFREQGLFFMYFRQAPPEDRDKLKKFINEYGEEGLKTFVACEYGAKAGDAILNIAQQADKPVAELVFQKYSEIVGIADNITTNLEGKLEDGRDVDPQAVDSIRENLLSQGKDLLVGFSDKITQTDPNELKRRLGRVRADTLLLGDILRHIDTKLENLVNVTFETKNASDLTSNEKKKIMDLSESNYGEGEFAKRVVFPPLQKALEGETNQFFILKDGGDIIAFLRLENQEDDSVYFGSFNVDEDAKGAGIGREMMTRTVDVVAQDKKVIAYAETTTPITSHYVNKMGFVVEKIIPDVEGTGVDDLFISRDDSIEYEREAPTIGVSKKEFLAEAQERVNNGDEVITYFRYDSGDNMYFVSFEKRGGNQNSETASHAA